MSVSESKRGGLCKGLTTEAPLLFSILGYGMVFASVLANDKCVEPGQMESKTLYKNEKLKVRARLDQPLDELPKRIAFLVLAKKETGRAGYGLFVTVST